MQSHSATCFFFFFVIVLAFVATRGDGLQRRTYIVRVRAPENTSFVRSKDLANWYRSFLPPIPVNVADSRLIYTYSAAIIGFAANLTDDEVRYVEKREGSLKVYPDHILPLLTTHTPEFLGLQARHGFWDANGMGKGVIIGVLDTGIKPGHPSFDDTGMPSPPPKWKGACKFKKPYCNNKLIGARRFPQGSREDPTDFVGHGTHTAGTAAGNFVKKANVLGNGNGTAVGMAPYAHLAIYQVCQSIGCFASDILAGIDAAIEDGADVLSLSLGGESRPFYDDVIAIGAFSAVEKGIFVSCAAGNAGPMSGTLSNEAPWVLTVGASSMDRKIKATVKLGNGQEVEGESAFQPADFPSKMIPLVYPIGTALTNCNPAALSSTNVTGKMVICDRAGTRIELGAAVKEAGGAAVVILNKETDGCTTLAEAHYLPASDVSYINGSKILSYINSTDKPLATISFEGTSLGISPAPVITFFSSRGPNTESPGILKPDIIGPGLNVVAAWPFQVGPSVTNVTAMTFNIISGTSMSTPHLSGIAALIKGAHPDWSPAAIKSAIMTTSDTTDRDDKPIMDETLHPASLFAMGAGHVNPSKAAKPGLVYDLCADDYVPYLCGLGYTDQQVEAITNRKINCSTIKNISEAELNYPSIAVTLELGHLTVNRTLTNVEEESSTTYTVAIDMPKDISVSVSPKTLEFSKLKEKKSFTVSLSWNPNTTTQTEGAFRWVSTKYVVRSPIVIFKNN